jgi:hypothetical protein
VAKLGVGVSNLKVGKWWRGRRWSHNSQVPPSTCMNIDCYFGLLYSIRFIIFSLLINYNVN